jgi:hypothetical protein
MLYLRAEFFVIPSSIEDVTALISLYRPGPMDSIPAYVDTKAGRKPLNVYHPLLESVLTETYGVIVYQEQVMNIARIMAGYSLGEADLLRRAMGKKKKEEMDQQRARFLSGASERGVDPDLADTLFELMAKFSGYGFNKGHAAPYALIGYQTAWLKANAPVEFFAASMSLDISNTDKLTVFYQDARRFGVVVGEHRRHVELHTGVAGEKVEGLGAVGDKRVDTLAIEVAARLVLQVGPGGTRGFGQTLLGRQVGAGHPQPAAGSSSGAAVNRRFFHDQHLQPLVGRRHRGRHARGASPDDQHVYVDLFRHRRHSSGDGGPVH